MHSNARQRSGSLLTDSLLTASCPNLFFSLLFGPSFLPNSFLLQLLHGGGRRANRPDANQALPLSFTASALSARSALPLAATAAAVIASGSNPRWKKCPLSVGLSAFWLRRSPSVRPLAGCGGTPSSSLPWRPARQQPDDQIQIPPLPPSLTAFPDPN